MPSKKRSARIVWRILKIAAAIRPKMLVVFAAGAMLEIGASILSLYATARLGAVLAQFATTGIAEDAWFWLFVDIGAAIAIGLGFMIMSYARRILYFAFTQWTMLRFTGTLHALDIGAFYDDQTRNKINKVSGAYTWQISSLAETTFDLLYGIVRFLAITVVAAQITWWIIPIIALFLLPTLFAERRVARLQWFVWDQQGDERHVFWGLEWITRQVKGQMEMRSTQANNYIQGRIKKMNESFYNKQEKEYREASRLLIVTKVLEVAGTAIGSVAVLRQFLAKTITIDRYFFLSGALFRVGSSLNAIFGTLSRMQDPLLFAEDFFDLTDTQPKIVDKPHALQLDVNKTPDIKITNLTFTYPGQKKPVFKDLNLHIRPGEHVALVGENGAGKSTLIKLLLRFYVPTSGKIEINGIDLEELAIDSWYTQIATLFQDFNHYPFPIDENIFVGRSDREPNTELLHSAAHFGNVDELVAGYEHGWDTVLDSSFKKGIEPSGGQWQRVALARSFYRNGNVLILDEPTSAIDAKAEYDIFNSIFDHYKDRTTLIVSHRFSTVRRADRIVVLEKGKIIEEGSHAELIQKNGVYQGLFHNQAKGYQD